MTSYCIVIDTSEQLEIGSAATPSDLAHALAHALLGMETHASPRPSYKVCAEEDGDRRDLTEAEQESFRMALEQALKDVGHRSEPDDS